MGFLETVEQARAFLERNGRVSLGALRLEFGLDDEALEALAVELCEVQQVAVREGKTLAFSGSIAASSGRAAASDPRAYTPRHLADKILRSKSAIEGERKQVTVLFADVKGSMELASQVDAEEWHRILDRFFGILTEGVHRFEGTVNQYTGDGIMALFGAPIAHEDHAQRACYAALSLRDAIAAWAAELRLSHGLDFAVRMGMNTGDVVVGTIGDDLRMDYTAQGLTVGLAQRLEQMAPAQSIYLSDAAAQLVSGYMELAEIGDATAKGLPGKVRVFEMLGPGHHRTRLDVARSRGLSRFVGRDADLHSLETALEQAVSGDGQVVGVVAEAGVGKSRLCFEFLERCRARGIGVDEGHCPPHGETVPYLPLLELLRSIFGIGEHDGGAEARVKIAGELSLAGEGFEELLPLLFDLLGVPDPERPAPPLPPDVRLRQLSAFLRHLVQARSARAPRVLFVDDAHWIDSASDAFLAQIVEAVSGTRTLVLVNFRPEYQAEWMGRGNYRQLPLRPLGREATEELLADLLGLDPSLSGLAETIHERTRGNPFFVEEAVLSLVESGCLEGSRGAHRLVAPVASLEIPDAVQVVLAARIDRLPEREKRLLQTASVIGREVPAPLLERVAELSETELSAALAALVQGEFLFEEALYPDAVYAFKHPLTHEVAYRSQLAERRARTHAAVARALEEMDDEHLDEQAGLVAHHWEEAGEPLLAARWSLRAGERAEAVFDVRVSLFHRRKARELLEGAAESEERAQLELEVCRQLVTFLAWQGGPDEEITALFERGSELAEARGEWRVLGQLNIHYGVWCGFTKTDIPGLGRHIRRAAELADRVGDEGIAVAAAAGLALLGFAEGRLPEAIATGRRALERAPDDLMLGAEYWFPPPVMWLNGFTLSNEGWAGRPAESRAGLEQTFEQARSLGSGVQVAIACLWGAQLAEILGDPAEVMAHAEQLHAFITQAGTVLGGSDHYYIGISHLLAGNAAESVRHLERARDIHEERPAAPLDVVGAWSRLAVAYAETGRGELACETAARGVELTRERLPSMTAPALTMQARVLRSVRGAEAREEIEAALNEADELVERMGVLSCRPFIHVERAELAGLCGDLAARDREFREAHRLFTEMGAAGRAAEVERCLER